MRRALAWSAASLLAFSVGEARASLSEDVAVTERALLDVQAVTSTTTHAFLEAGQVASAPITPAEPGRCVVAVVLADRTIGFAVASVRARDERDTGDELDGEDVTASVNGVAVVEVCDDDDAASAVLVRMGAPRAAVAIVVASVDLTARSRVVDLTLEALSRVDGPSPLRADLGPPLDAGPFAVRKARGRRRALARGATNVLSTEAVADDAGEGSARLALVRGCHVLRVLSAEAMPRDVDAELWDEELSERLARDRSDLQDAHLSLCVAATTQVVLTWKGALARGRVVFEDELTPITRGIPSGFGAQAETALAALFHDREASMPSARPIVEVLGAQGANDVTVPVEPGRCYVAALALVRGAGRGLRLSAGDTARPSLVEAQRGARAASVQFCAVGASAPIHMDVPGAAMTWLLTLWLVGDDPRSRPEQTAPLVVGEPAQ